MDTSNSLAISPVSATSSTGQAASPSSILNFSMLPTNATSSTATASALTSPTAAANTPPPHATFKDLPEFFETTLGEALAARADQLNQFRLGPPDLCHLVKAHTKTNALVSSYHFVVGQPAHSPGALATYMHHLLQQYQRPDASKPLVPHAAGTYRITSAMYCCYHPFAKLDVRVEVNFPGTVLCHAMNTHMKRVDVDTDHPTFWTELHLAATLRALDPYTRLPGLHQLPALLLEDKLFRTLANILPSTWSHLGPDPLLPAPTPTQNKCVWVLVEHFGHTLGRWDQLQAIWTAFLDAPSQAYKEDYLGLLAQAYLADDMDTVAAKVLYQGLKAHPNNVCLLSTQVDFLLKKKKLDYALAVARRLVATNPLEFGAWYRMVQVYVEREDWSRVLLTMNLCPMFAPSVRDTCALPMSQRWFPSAVQEPVPDDDAVGPMACMYATLARVVQAIGWEAMLKLRASVFVMEHEQSAYASKRLCERWFDELFVRMYQELSFHATHKIHVKRSAQEWEQLADVTARLGFAKDAMHMFLTCLATHHASKPVPVGSLLIEVLGRKLAFVPRILLKLLRTLESIHDSQHGLRVIIKLFEQPQYYCSLAEGVYGDVILPNPIGKALFHFIQISGLAYIQSELMHLKPPSHVYKRITALLEYAEKVRVKGYDR